MRLAFRTTLATVVLATAALAAACSTSPLEPTAPVVGPKDKSGFVVGRDKGGQPTPSDPMVKSGFVITWGVKDTTGTRH